LTLKLRLNLIITLLLLAIMFAGTLMSINNARQNTEAEVKSAEKLVLYLFDTAILNNDKLTQKQIEKHTFNLQHLQHMRHIKIELTNEYGDVVDSNHLSKNEATDEAPRWFKALLNRFTPPWSPSIRTLEYQGKVLGKLIITPDPDYEYAEKWKQLIELLTLISVFFVLVNLSVIWAVAQALKPTERILSALNALEEGKLDTRLPQFNAPELAPIGDKFNHMIAKLELSIRQNHKLTHELISLQEQERKSLARDLHDEFGQCLTAINTDASIILKASDKKYPELRDSALAISQLSRHLTDMVTGLLQQLRPGLLEELGLQAALDELVTTWKSRHKEVKCDVSITPIHEVLEEAKGITLYRLTQECLTNITKHSNATVVDIQLFYKRKSQQEGLQLIVKDNGQGFNLNNTIGFGLPGMRERVEGLNGDLIINTTLGEGTEINAWIPIQS
jgi:two-component system, NarL family, sensor histidine kinase UhpB